MNRQIKFRAWCSGKHHNMTFTKDFMDYDVVLKNGHYASAEGDWDIQGVYPTVPIMQFTGLHDKNGKEIYEGDILRHHSYEDWFWRGVVKFSHGVFGVEWLPSEKNLSMLGSWGQLHNLRKLDDGLNEKQIVIGNIYQNPELLNK